MPAAKPSSGISGWLCAKSTDGSQCITKGDWDQGWIIFVDVDNAARVADAKDILRVRGALTERVSLTGNQAVRNYFSY